MRHDERSPGIGKPLTLTALDLGGNQWVAWVRKMSLQRYIAKTVLSPDKQLLVSVAGLSKRWGVSQSYIYKLVKDERLEATVLEDTYGQKLAFGISYAEVLRYEKDARKRGLLRKLDSGVMLQPE